MAHSLALLRDFVSLGRDISYVEEKEELVFGDHHVHKDTPTNYHSNRGKGDPYTVGACWFCIKHEGLKYAAYLVECSKWKFPKVSLVDRKDLTLYLRGKVHSSNSIIAASVAAPSAIKPQRTEDDEPQAKRVRAEDEVFLDITAQEHALRPQNSVLRSSKKHFTNVLKIIATTKDAEARRKAEASRDATQTSSRGTKPSRRDQKRRQIPIIVVPSSLTSLINIYNAKDLLEDGRFVKWQDKKAAGAKKERVTVHRKKKGLTVPYHVVDTTSKLTDGEWENVLAVFTQGKAWQFTGWKWEQPVELFSTVLGANVRWDDEHLDANVATWNVKQYSINKNKRHLDQRFFIQFWTDVDHFAAAKKPHLTY